MAKSRGKEIERRGNLLRQARWAGLSAGDQVIINLEKERRATYVFVAHVENMATGESWVEVRGGRKGEQKDRSFRPDVIFPATARRGAKIVGPSYAEAPQLPLR